MASKFLKSKSNLLIVDGLNLAFRFKHSNKRNFAGEYLATVMSFANSYNAKEVLVLSDGGSKYRNEIYSNYKGDRKAKRAEQTKEEATEFQEFLSDWELAFQMCGTKYPKIKFAGVEADDIAAYVALDSSVRASYDHIWLLSTDRDWDLLVSDKVSRFSYRTRKEVTVGNWEEHYPYSVEEHISVKVLQGDKSDTIPGIPGIGEKRAAALVRSYGSAYDIYASIPLPGTQVFIKNLNASEDLILTNYKLMDLVSYAEDAIGEGIDELDNFIKTELL